LPVKIDNSRLWAYTWIINITRRSVLTCATRKWHTQVKMWVKKISRNETLRSFILFSTLRSHERER